MTVTNELEIQLFGMQRSGNHMLITWILKQYDNPVVFLNNVNAFDDPFMSYRQARIENALPLPNKVSGKRRLDEIRVQNKELLLYSYENLNISLLSNRDPVADRVNTVGLSKRFVRILIIRDFLNCLASRVILHENKGQGIAGFINSIDGYVGLWLTYAREFVGETSWLHGDADVLAVSYNRFISDEGYRSHICRRLNLPNARLEIGFNPLVGKSSFRQESDFQVDRAANHQRRWEVLSDERFSALRKAVREKRNILERYDLEIAGHGWADF